MTYVDALHKLYNLIVQDLNHLILNNIIKNKKPHSKIKIH